MKFILICHTTTDWHLSGRIQGQKDTELNKQGLKETEELSEKLLGLNIPKIISSDLLRCKQTAEIINKKLQVPLYLETGLRECSFGAIEGMTKKEAIKKHGDSIIKHWDSNYKEYDFQPFGVENCEQVLERHMDVLKKYFNNSENPILVVGHVRGLNTLLYELGYPPNLKKGEYRTINIEDF